MANTGKKRDYRKKITTTDNWYGNFEGNKVEVHLAKYDYVSCGKRYRYSSLQVWGNDDFGLVLEMDYDDFDFLKKMYDKLPEPITKEWCFTKGFVVA